jgi:hypothetical protein
MKHIQLIFLIVSIPILTFGQSDYYATDTTASYGIKLKDGGDLMNSRLCQVKQGENIILLTPYEVKEYGFKDGRVYISKEIQIADSSKRVFVERLLKGKTTLYYYKGKGTKTFFIDNDSALFLKVPKRNTAKEHYSELLLNLTKDCPKVSDACKLVSYNKRSFSEFYKRYNHCELKPFPFLKYGMFLGGIHTKPVLNKTTEDGILENASFDPDYSFSYGIFIDAPLFVSNFSILFNVGFYRSCYSSYYKAGSIDYDILIEQSTIKIPLLFKYSFPYLKYRPYINTGLNYLFNVKNESTIYEAAINDDVVQFNAPNRNDLLSDHLLGFSCGIGIQYHINYKRIVFLEFRFGKDYSLYPSEIYNKNSIELLSGINF